MLQVMGLCRTASKLITLRTRRQKLNAAWSVHVTSPNSVALGAITLKQAKQTHTVCDKNVAQSIFSDISFLAIFAEVTENECIIERHLCDIDPLRDSLSLAYLRWGSQRLKVSVRFRFDRNGPINTIQLYTALVCPSVRLFVCKLLYYRCINNQLLSD